LASGGLKEEKNEKEKNGGEYSDKCIPLPEELAKKRKREKWVGTVKLCAYIGISALIVLLPVL
jgi:hypothetical protein